MAPEEHHHVPDVINSSSPIPQEDALFNPHLFPLSDDISLAHGTVLPSFSLVSVISNLFVFSVLLSKNRGPGPTSLSLLLQCLAFYDVGVSTLSVWAYSVPVWVGPESEYLHKVHPYITPYLFPVLHMFITGSDYLNLAAAVERYVALDRFFMKTKAPHSGCLPGKTYFYIGVIFVFTVAFNIPSVWERSVLVHEDGTIEAVATSLRYVRVREAQKPQIILLGTEFPAYQKTRHP